MARRLLAGAWSLMISFGVLVVMMAAACGGSLHEASRRAISISDGRVSSFGYGKRGMIGRGR